MKYNKCRQHVSVYGKFKKCGHKANYKLIDTVFDIDYVILYLCSKHFRPYDREWKTFKLVKI
jgi:hypothetical protein